MSEDKYNVYPFTDVPYWYAQIVTVEGNWQTVGRYDSEAKARAAAIDAYQQEHALSALKQLFAADTAYDEALTELREAEGFGHGRKFVPSGHPALQKVQKAQKERLDALERVKGLM